MSKRHNYVLESHFILAGLVAHVLIGICFGPVACAAEPAGSFVNVAPVVAEGLELKFNVGGPDISSDGLELFVDADEWPLSNLYVLSRNSTDEPFGSLTNLETINSPGHDAAPSISADGLTLYFQSDRPGGEGNRDIWTATRSAIGQPFGDVTNLGPTVNTRRREEQPSPSLDGLTLFFWSHADGISTAIRTDHEEPFGDVANLGPPLSRTGVDREYDAWPDISSDGLTLFFASLRPGINTQWRDLFVATRDSIDEEFGEPINLDEFSLGSDVNNQFRGNCCIVDPNISSDWPALGSKLYFQAHKSIESGGKIYEATWIPEISGDYSGDSEFTDLDIDLLSKKVHAELHPFGFDLNDDELVDQLDRQKWVHEIKSTYFGDANLDGEFNSGDMVEVFKAGRYEVDQDTGWAEGDWTGDQRFDSSDFIVAFQDGGYELGPRVAANAVPEPSGALLLGIGIIGVCRLRLGRPQFLFRD